MGEILTFKPNETTGNGEVRDNRDIISHEEDYSNLRHGGEIMENKYITEKDLSNLEEKTDLKLQNISDKIENNFKLVDEKFNTLETNISKMFLEQKNEQLERDKKESKETRRWIVGTGIAVIGLLFTLLKFFV